MVSHLNRGELYAFATMEGSCIVGKIVGSRPDSVDVYLYDKLFQPLSQKTDVVKSLVAEEPSGFATTITRRHFAMMYPLFLAEQSVEENETPAKMKAEIVVSGRKMRFRRSRPYWEPLCTLAFTWFLIFVLSLPVCIANAAMPGALVVAFLGSISMAAPIGGTIAFMSFVFRFIESLRSGVSIRTNPTSEITLAMPLEEAFTRCRDRLGKKSNREFDFVDRRSGYIQARDQEHLLMRIMCYQIDDEHTGAIVSCFDLKGGIFGNDMWAMKNMVAILQAPEGEAVLEQGPLVIGAWMHRLFWFAMTAVFACVSAMFLKAAIQGELACLPLLLLTAVLTGFAGFYLFRPAKEAAGPN